MDDAVDAALGAAFPDREVSAAEARESRPGNETREVRFADGARAFLKVVTDGRGTWLAREAAAARFAAANTGVAAPSVLAADPDHDPPYLATAPLGGRPVAAAWERGDADRRAALAR
ncbi:MAG: aminoglycoside phosphotransferase family protein, partial [Halobacteriaceae archaeon]